MTTWFAKPTSQIIKNVIAKNEREKKILRLLQHIAGSLLGYLQMKMKENSNTFLQQSIPSSIFQELASKRLDLKKVIWICFLKIIYFQFL